MRFTQKAVVLLLTLSAMASGFSPLVRSVTWSPSGVVPTVDGLHFDPSATQDLAQSNIWVFWSSTRVPVRSDIYYMKYNPSFGTWQSEVQVTQNAEDDNSPAVTTLTNGTIILFWAAKRTAVGASFDIYTKHLTAGIWSPEVRLTTSALDDDKPAVLQDRAGKIWVAWNRNVTGNIDLFYDVYESGLWQGETRFTSTIGEDRQVSLTQTKDGRIWAIWTARLSQAVTFIQYSTFNGTAWSPPTILAQSNDGDIDPSIVQDREGTLWVVWTRNIKVGNSYQGDLYYKNSTNNGASWTAPVAFSTTSTLDEIQPSIEQFDDRRLWIFYSRIDEDANLVTLNYRNSSPILNIHDVRMDSLTAAPVYQALGGSILLTSQYTNVGDSLETAAHLVLKANNTVLSDTTNIIRVGETIVFTFNWNTQGFSPGTYLLSARVSIPGETVGNSQDNIFNAGEVIVRFNGDVNNDCTVNIIDLALVGASFGSTGGPPPSPNWNEFADLNYDNAINIIDLASVGSAFGQSCV